MSTVLEPITQPEIDPLELIPTAPKPKQPAPPVEVDERAVILLRAAELLRQRGWCQGAGSPHSGPICILQAVGIARDGSDAYSWADMATLHVVDPALNECGDVFTWNDGLRAGSDEKVIRVLERLAQGKSWERAKRRW